MWVLGIFNLVNYLIACSCMAPRICCDGYDGVGNPSIIFYGVN